MVLLSRLHQVYLTHWEDLPGSWTHWNKCVVLVLDHSLCESVAVVMVTIIVVNILLVYVNCIQ